MQILKISSENIDSKDRRRSGAIASMIMAYYIHTAGYVGAIERLLEGCSMRSFTSCDFFIIAYQVPITAHVT